MTIPSLLVIVGLVLALIEQFEAQGRSKIAWAVVFVCLALLYGQFIR